MNWTLTAPIISHEKNYRFDPITNKHQEIIIKYCMGKDGKGLVLFMQDMLQQLILDENVVIKDLPVIDQLFLMIRLRSLCIGTKLDVVSQDPDTGESKKYKISLIDVQKSINEHYLQPKIILDDRSNIEIKLHYPTTWGPLEDHDYITEINIDGTQYDIGSLSKTQKAEIIENFPRDIQLKVTNGIDEISNSISKMVFLRVPEGENITLIHDQYIHILRVVFSDTLNNFIELMYVFVKVMNFTLSDAMKLTPSDTQLYYQMFIKEMNEKEKAALNAQNQAAQAARQVPSR